MKKLILFLRTKRLLSTWALTCLLPLMTWAAVWQDPETKVNYSYTPGYTSAYVTSGGYNPGSNTDIAGSPDAAGDIEILSSFTVNGNTYSVKSIGYGAFYGCNSLTSISIPESVIEIMDCAFEGCSNLMDIVIPENMIYIGDAFRGTSWYNNQPDGLVYLGNVAYSYKGKMPSNTSVVIKDGCLSIATNAFESCKNLTNITIPEGVIYIGERAFYNCDGLSSITIPGSVTRIGHEVFSGCDYLANITLSEGITNISPSAFAYCNGLKNIILPESLISIEMEAFANCASLTSITIPASVTTINDGVFRDCYSLASINIPESVTYIGEEVFDNTAWLDNQPSGLLYIGKVAYKFIGTMPDNTEIIIKDGTTQISGSAFYGCSGLTSIAIPNSVNSIGGYAFLNCTGLTSITIPNGVKVISGQMFYGCSGLTSVTIPSSVNFIGYRAFYGCNSLTSITSYITEPFAPNTEAFSNECYQNATLYVPEDVLEAYSKTNGWKNFTILPILSFQDCSISISLPDGTNAKDYSQMWLELTNTKNGQRMHYVMTDRTLYTFANVGSYTSWNVTLRNERGDVFGQINNIEVKNKDVSVTFTSLSKPQNVSLSVLTPDGNDVTDKVKITWTDASNNYVAQGTTLQGLPIGYQASYRIVLSQELAMAYNTPLAAEYTLQDGNNQIAFQLEAIRQIKLSGKVKDAQTGLPLSGATVSASQTFGGKYSKTQNAKTDGNGVFILDVACMPTSLAFAATDYISQTIDYTNNEFNELSQFSVPDVSLKSITGATITIEFSYTNVEGETQNWYSDYQNVSYELFNVTKNCAISKYNVQYPQIVLLEDVDEGDVLRLIATSRTKVFNAVEATVTIAEQKATASFGITELGKILASFDQTGNATVVGSLYDASGKLVKTYNYSEASLTINDLTDGQYTLVSMGSSRLFNTIYDLTQLPQTGLAEGIDYVLNTVTVRSGAVSQISISQVPTFDESKLYYTGDNTSFTVNKSSIVVGNYLTLTGHIDFKPDYTADVSNVQMVVDLPESCSFIEYSVMVGNSISAYTINGSQLTIPLARYTDRIRFCIIPTLGGEYAPSAFVQFDLNGETVTQPIGSANYVAKDLSISVPSKVAKTTIPVSGTVLGGSSIDIYDNNILIGQTTSLANGTWLMTCELNEPYNLSRHNIYAHVTTKAGLELQSETKECIYDKNTIEVKTVTMINTAHGPESLALKDYVTVFDFQNPSNEKKTYWYWPSYPDFTFILDFTNNDSKLIKGICLNVYTSSGDIRKLYPQYDEKTDLYIVCDKFYSNSLPINVSIDFCSNHQIELDDEQLSKAYNQYSTIIDDYNEIIKKTDKIISDANMYAYNDDIEQYLLSDNIDSFISILDNSSEQVVMPEMEVINTLSNLNEDDFFMEMEKRETHIGNTISMISEYAQQIGLKYNKEAIYYDLSVPVLNGNYICSKSVRKCSYFTESDLCTLGYTKVPTTNGKRIYEHFGENTYDILNIDDNYHMYISITKTANSRSSAKRNKWSYDSDLNSQSSTLLKSGMAIYDYELSNAKQINEKYLDFLDELERLAKEDLKSFKNQAKKIGLSKYKSNFQKGIVDNEEWIRKIKQERNALLHENKILKWGGNIVGAAATFLNAWDIGSKAFDLLNKIEEVNIPYCLYQNVPEETEQLQNRLNDMMEDLSNWIALQFARMGIWSTTEAYAGLGVLVIAPIETWIEKKRYEQKETDVIYNLSTIKSRLSELERKYCKGDKETPTSGVTLVNPNVEPIQDPSGFVYEGVPSNRLEGVTATVYYKEMVEDMYGDLHENILKWDASEYAQENPLFTDEYGMYRWDVPQGLWQVKFEKEGYETIYSEWLPVPPPQLDVNIAMKQSKQPEVKTARAYEDAVEVEFDKFMIPDLLNTENILVLQNGEAVEGLVELLNNETAYEGSEETFASKVRFNATQPFTELEVTLMVNNCVKSYAGVCMQDNYQQTFAIEQEIRQIVSDKQVTIDYGDNATLTVSVLPASASNGKTLKVKNSSPMILGVETDHVIIGNDGKAEIIVSGELPGTAGLTFYVEGTDKTAITIANVEKIYRAVASPTASISSGQAVGMGTQITLTCETEGATIYYTLDGSCPCEESKRIEYTEPIVISKGMTLKVIAVKEGMDDSEIAEFVYGILGDVNGDGKVDVADVVAVMNYILDKPTNAFNFDAANMNGDSVVDLEDVESIVNTIMGQ